MWYFASNTLSNHVLHWANKFSITIYKLYCTHSSFIYILYMPLLYSNRRRRICMVNVRPVILEPLPLPLRLLVCLHWPWRPSK